MATGTIHAQFPLLFQPNEGFNQQKVQQLFQVRIKNHAPHFSYQSNHPPHSAINNSEPLDRLKPTQKFSNWHAFLINSSAAVSGFAGPFRNGSSLTFSSFRPAAPVHSPATPRACSERCGSFPDSCDWHHSRSHRGCSVATTFSRPTCRPRHLFPTPTRCVTRSDQCVQVHPAGSPCSSWCP